MPGATPGRFEPQILHEYPVAFDIPRLEFMLRMSSPNDVAHPGEARPLEYQARPGTVLLVDDDPAMRAIYGTRLLADGFDVRFAVDGPEALRAVAAPPDLIILDVRMPGMCGFEVLRRLKDDAASAVVPVVMLSNECDLEAGACRAMGALAWWRKHEVRPAELSRRIRELLPLPVASQPGHE
jgi:two-component system response regulator PrrA